MGKKSSSSAPSIPKEVGQAQLKLAEVAEREQDWMENTIMPWYMDSTEKQNALQEKLTNQYLSDSEWYRKFTTEQTDKANAIRDEYYDHWKNDYKPIEQGLIDKAIKFNEPAYAEQQAQAAIGDVASQYANQRQQTAMNMSKYGIDPSSGAFMGQMNALGINQSAATAAASNAARQAAVQLGWDKSLQLANLGVQYAGITNNATSGVNQTVGTGSSAVNNSMGGASNSSTQQLQNIGGLATTGLQSYQTLSNAWGSYGQLANQTYQNQLSAWQAQQQAKSNSSAGIGSLVGSVATTAAVAF